MPAETSVTVVTAIVPEVSVTPFDVASTTPIEPSWWEMIISFVTAWI